MKYALHVEIFFSTQSQKLRKLSFEESGWLGGLKKYQTKLCTLHEYSLEISSPLNLKKFLI